MLFFFIIISLLGIILGFTKTFASLNPNRWIHGLIPVLLITIIVERLRYILIKNNSTDKFSIYTITILLIVFNIALYTNISSLNSLYKIFLFLSVTFMPIVAQEMLTTYLACNYGFLPAIGYKLIMNLYVYIIPVTTDLGDYLYGSINVIMPFVIYIVLNKYLMSDKDIREKNKKIKGINLEFVTIPAIIFLTIIIILVSGIFKYKMVAIASNSMTPTFERGDAIIYEKIDKDTIKVGDVIAFNRDNILVVHRVVKIKETPTEKYFYTKGDANNSADQEPVPSTDVQGRAIRVTKYIGYPTVLINELVWR